MASLVEPRPRSAPAGTWRDLWTPPRARVWLIACVAAAYLPALGVPLRGWLDFSAFYAAGALAGTPEVARLSSVVAYQAAHGLPITPFVYPAAVALFYVPFAALPYGLAAALHLALMAAALLAAAVLGADLVGLPRRWAALGALAWGPAAAGVVSGQNVAAALLLVTLSAAALARQRPVLGGAWAGLLAYKPQLAAPLLGLLVLRRGWAALVGFGVMLAVGYVAGIVAAGGNPAWPVDWMTTLRGYATADFMANGWQAISLPAVGQRLELVLGVPGLTLAGYLVGFLIVALCLPALRSLPIVEAVALACACGLVVSPHAWVYDATLLLPAIGVYAARAARAGWPWRSRWWLAACFALGLTWPLGGPLGITAMPLVVVAVPFALLGWGPFREPGARSVPGDAQAAPTGSLPLGQ